MEKSKIREILHSLDMERRKIIRPKFQELGLTVGEGQAKILKCLLEQGSMTQRELADRCMLDVTTMSRTLDKLQGQVICSEQSTPPAEDPFLSVLQKKGKKRPPACRKYFPIWTNRSVREYQKTRWKRFMILCRRS